MTPGDAEVEMMGQSEGGRAQEEPPASDEVPEGAVGAEMSTRGTEEDEEEVEEESGAGAAEDRTDRGTGERREGAEVALGSVRRVERSASCTDAGGDGGARERVLSCPAALVGEIGAPRVKTPASDESDGGEDESRQSRLVWFAKKDNSVTRRLRELLEAHEESLDARFVRQSSFSKARETGWSVCENVGGAAAQARGPRLDFWSSTAFHGETPRPSPGPPVTSQAPTRHFFRGQVVIFIDPQDPSGKRECTGQVLQSPLDASVTTRPRNKLLLNGIDATCTGGTVRRSASAAGLYTVAVLSESIIGGLLHAEPHQIKRMIEPYLEGRGPGQVTNAHGKQLKGKSRSKRFRLRRELLKWDQLEGPGENKKRKLKRVMGRWILRFLENGLRIWTAYTAASREAERRLRAALRVQAFWRGVLGARMSFEKRIAAQMVADQQRAERERLEREAEAERQRLAHEAFLRENGVTRDGVRYFLNQEELEAFYSKQERMCERMEAAMERLATGLKADAMQRWKYHLERVLPPKHLDVGGLSADVRGLRELLLRELEESHRSEHGPESSVLDELGDLSSKLHRIAQREAARRNEERAREAMERPWHPAVNVRLPALPTTGVQVRADGSLQVVDLARFDHFKKKHAGPTDNSSWLVNGAYARIMFGGYPIGQARAGSKVTSRSASVASLLVAGVDTFVCLLAPEELQRAAAGHSHGLTFLQEARETCRGIRSELEVGVKACHEAHAFAESRAKRGREVGYGRPQQEALERAAANRLKDLNRARAQLDNFSPNVDAVFLAMPKDGVMLDEEALLDLCSGLEQRLRRRERLYVFSLGGSGRAGIVAALLLGRLYGLDPHAALERVQRCHDAQARFAGKPARGGRSCPRLNTQRQQVVRLLQHTEPAYDRQGSLAEHTRGQPLPQRSVLPD